MARGIAFDKATAQALSRNLHLLTVCDSEADPVQSALHSASPTTLLAMPAETGKRVLLAVFRRPQAHVPPPLPSNEPAAFEASGFLGLGDQPVYAPEPESPKNKKWWRKIVE